MIKRFSTLAAGLLLLFIGCTHRDDDGNLMVYHGVHWDDVKSWDPAIGYDDMSLDVIPSVYEQLYQYDYLSETFKTIPLLAASMPIYSKDRLTVKIPILKGVKFQDDPCFKETQGKGRELKAQDFIRGMKRIADPRVNSQGFFIFDGRIKGINEFHDKLAKASKDEHDAIFESEIEGMKALDDYTIQFKLTKPYPQLVYVLGMAFTSPVPQEATQRYGNSIGEISDHPVGTGPFILKKWDRGRKIILERNPNHHPETYPTSASLNFKKQGLLADAGKPIPFLDRISIDVIKENQPAWLNFMKGHIDNVKLPKDNFSQAIVNKVNLAPELVKRGARLSIETGILLRYVVFNTLDKTVGTNKYLRQAISSAIDRDKWIDIFTAGTGQKMTTALPPGTQDRPEHSQLKYDYNPARAKELLGKAGYPGGKGLPVLNFDMKAADTTTRQLGDLLSQQMAAIGIRMNIVYNTFPAYLEKLKQGNFQLAYGMWALDYPDAENVYQMLYGPNKAPGPNDSSYDDSKMNKLYEQIAVMEPSPKRAALVQQMDDVLQEECIWALGYYEAAYRVAQPWLLNFRGSDLIQTLYKHYKIDRDTKNRYLELLGRS